MTEFAPAQIPEVDAEDRPIHRRIAAKFGGFVMSEFVRPTVETFVDDKTNRNVAGSLAVVAAASTAAQVKHWFDHSGMALEFFEGSGRHFLAGYMGAMATIAATKAETVKGKIAAGLVGGALGDAAAELFQSIVVTGILHRGSLKDIMSFLSKKEIFWGNAKDALAAEMAAIGGIAQVLARRRSARAELPRPASEAI